MAMGKPPSSSMIYLLQTIKLQGMVCKWLMFLEEQYLSRSFLLIFPLAWPIVPLLSEHVFVDPVTTRI